MVTAEARRAALQVFVDKGLSQRAACRAFGVSHTPRRPVGFPILQMITAFLIDVEDRAMLKRSFRLFQEQVMPHVAAVSAAAA